MQILVISPAIFLFGVGIAMLFWPRNFSERMGRIDPIYRGLVEKRHKMWIRFIGAILAGMAAYIVAVAGFGGE